MRDLALALAAEFEGAVREAEFRAAGRPGMHVPFHGDFAAAVPIPSVVGQMRWWAKALRDAEAREQVK